MTIAAQLFFVEFGALDANRFRRVVEELPLESVEVARQVGARAGEYAQVSGGLAEALKLLFQGKTLGLSVTPRQGEIKWVLLFAPYAVDTSIPMWHGMLELRSESHEPLFRTMRAQMPEYVAVAKDEPFDLTARNLTPEGFPWGSRSFVAAALMDDHGKYMEHPQY